ncbi:MAG: PaaI family thioesterase [Bdellovibrionales bacterium]
MAEKTFLLPDDPFAGSFSFVSGSQRSDLIRSKYRTNGVRDRVFSNVWFGRRAEGPPGRAHGGAISAVLDEIMGASVWLSGSTAFTAELTVRFISGVPLVTPLRAEARVISVRDKKMCAQATLKMRDGTLLAEASAIFIRAPFNPPKRRKK